MPSRRLPLLGLAVAIAACALPATASARPSGGVAPPSSGSSRPDPSIPTGGASPQAPRAARANAAATKKKKPAKRTKKRHHSHPAPPEPSLVPDNPVPAHAGAGAGDIPSLYLRLYHAAADANGVSWRILAAIGKNESDHGRSKAPGVASGVNSARCCSGPMQICTKASCGNTWSAYAVDADGDGVKSVYSPADSIYAAAGLVSNLLTTFGNHPGLIMAAYNAGPGNVLRYHGVPPFAETKAYVARGLAYMGTLAP